MQVELTQTAEKQLAKLPKPEAKKAIRKLRSLGANPYLGKKLSGQLQGRYSLKAWPYRIVYIIDQNRNLMQVEVIQHRQGAYR